METGVFPTFYQNLTGDLVKVGVRADEAMFILVVEDDINITRLSKRKRLQRC